MPLRCVHRRLFDKDSHKANGIPASTQSRIEKHLGRHTLINKAVTLRIMWAFRRQPADLFGAVAEVNSAGSSYSLSCNSARERGGGQDLKQGAIELEREQEGAR